VQYPTLCHIKLLAARNPECFAADYRQFFCRVNDQLYIRKATPMLPACTPPPSDRQTARMI
jgi:hypothetical protein